MFRIKYCRETILKLLYLEDALKLENLDAPLLLTENIVFFKNLKPVETDFIIKMLEKVNHEKEHIDTIIMDNLIGWKLDRLMIVDRCLLRMGIAETSLNGQKAIVIDEMVRIAKKYGSEESFKIINALLDKVVV